MTSGIDPGIGPDSEPGGNAALTVVLGEAASEDELARAVMYLSHAMRTLRKYGFHVTQDPDAQARSPALQAIGANDAASMLLGLPPTPANVARGPVQQLGRALLDNATLSARRLRGRVD